MNPAMSLAAAAALLCAGSAFAVETGTLSRADSLREKPYTDAKVTAPLASGAKVEILQRNGGWYQVKAGTRTGWVRLLSVRRAGTTSGSTATGIAGVASGRTGTGTVVSTTGVRGLDSAELKTAAYDAAQVAQAEKYRVSATDAAAFAAQGKLKTQTVAMLPEPDKKKKKK